MSAFCVEEKHGRVSQGPFVSAKGPKTTSARVRPFGFPRLRTESHGCATRSAQTVLAEWSDSVLRRGRTQGRWEEINQKKIREILREFLIQSNGQAFGGAAGFF